MNVDFEDVKTMMNIGGHSIMGMGEGEGEEKILDAIKRAVENPFVDDKSIKGARGILVNFTCGEDTTIDEITKGVEYLTREAQPDAEVKFGVVIDEKYEGRVKATVIATGLSKNIDTNMYKKHPRTNTESINTPVNVDIISLEQDYNIANWGEKPADFDQPTFKRNNKKGMFKRF